ncbi:CocE/NonD family hydrolase [Synechococcus sp. M16CYN]|uniref:CocE/NonD family hydrolase n=1 Tax=Synechococcus sp. M16CYN TaxID=3103139 RepID=UPI00325081C5
MYADSSSVHSRVSELSLPDGVRLVANLWYPSGEGPWPTLLMRQPYDKSIASTVTYAHPSWWARQGFLVIIQDVRGQGQSTGVFQGFAQEAQDTAATHAWVRSLPECNGKLGCYGFSYQGLTQLLAPAHAQAPDCLAPAMVGLDERDNWSCEGGAHWWHLNLGWGLQLAALQTKRRGDNQAWLEIFQSLESGSYLQDGPELLQRYDPLGMAWTWLQRDPQRRDDWPVHQVQDSWLKQPMFLIGGWWDPHLLGVLDLWHKSQAVGGTPEIEVGAATHLNWWPGTQARLLTFFNKYLKGETLSETKKSAQFWNITRFQWEKLSAPPDVTWSLNSSGLACSDPNHGRLIPDAPGIGEEWIVHDPWRPALAIGGHLSPSAGPVDRRELDLRTDIATFNSVPLQQELLLSGRPQLSLNVEADNPGFDLCVGLSRCPAGINVVEQLSTGHLRVLGDKACTCAKYIVQFQPLLASLEIGDRLRVSIAAAAWPAIGVNPGHRGVPCGPTSAQHRVVTLILHLTGSKLRLNPLNFGQPSFG